MQSLESKWISEHSDIVDKYTGKWVALLNDRGIIASGDTIEEMQKELEKKNVKDLPLITKIPIEEEGMIIL